MADTADAKNMSSKMTRVDCMICAEEVYQRKMITCPFCKFEACVGCIDRFLMGIDDDKPRCMDNSCKKVWGFEFLASHFPPSFHNKRYRDRRAQLALEREKSLLPGTQPLVKQEKKRLRYSKKIEGLRDEISMYKELIYTREREIRSMEHMIRGRNNVDVKGEEEKPTFTRSCPVEDCRGFLSNHLKCGTCSTYACRDCLLPKASKNDEDHKCDPDLVATVKLLANDTKPCPACATPIYKIHGCFDGQTVIPMWDGHTKIARDIAVGDEIIGDDGNMRTVTSTTHGEDNMYKIIQNKADDYIVNSNHILTLKACRHKTVNQMDTRWKVTWFDHNEIKYRTKNFDDHNDAQEFANSIETSNIVELTVGNYMELPKSTKATLFGYRSTGVNWGSDVKVDPYIIGSWLGDGTATHANITGNDIEVVQRWIDWAEKNDAEIVHTQACRFSVRRFGTKLSRDSIGSEVGKCKGCKDHKFSLCDTVYEQKGSVSGKRTNPLTDALNQYNLVGNKHIPLDYMTGSRSTRLELLAGLIDTDGYVSNDGKRVTIIQKEPVLSEQIISLSRSLGFVTHSRMRTKKQVKLPDIDELKDYEDQYEINISGETLNEIPTLIPRKKCTGTTSNKDYLLTSIKIESVGQGEYFGWEIDGNKRFVLKDYTVVHNCDQMYCTQCHTAFSWTRGTIERGVIHNPHFYEVQRAMNGGVAPRNAGDMYCGGLPNMWIVSDRLDAAGVVWNRATSAHMLVNHINMVELPRYPNVLGDVDNSKLRVDYLLNRITEKQWVSKLKMQIKKQEKNNEMHMILEMFTATLTDIFGNIVSCNPEDVSKFVVSAVALIEYTNKELRKIGLRYGNVYPAISRRFTFYPNASTMEKSEAREDADEKAEERKNAPRADVQQLGVQFRR